MICRTLPAAVAALTLAASASADSVQLGALRDGTLFEHASNINASGAGPTMFAGKNNANLIRRTLLDFDVAAAVPAGSTITSATLRLNLSQSAGGVAGVSLHPLLADWGTEASNSGVSGGAGVPAQANDATWFHTFFSASTWAAPGGDFNPASSAATNVDGIGFYSWSSVAMVADVQSWLNNPATAFGWLVKGDEITVQSAKRFDTREAADAGVRPVLFIEYTPVPAPTGLALLGLGAGVAARRRRA